MSRLSRGHSVQSMRTCTSFRSGTSRMSWDSPPKLCPGTPTTKSLYVIRFFVHRFLFFLPNCPIKKGDRTWQGGTVDEFSAQEAIERAYLSGQSSESKITSATLATCIPRFFFTTLPLPPGTKVTKPIYAGKRLEECILVRIHAGSVFTLAPVQENIFEDLFLEYVFAPLPPSCMT